MRIFAVADIHARFDRLHRIRETLADTAVDVLVIAGDLCRLRRKPEALLDQFEELTVPMLAIRGNSDPGRLEELFEIYPNVTPLHLKSVNVAGVPFAGVSGALTLPLASRIGWKERDVEARLRKLVTSQTVLVVHPPPWGVLDQVLGRFHAGSRAVTRLIARAKPRLVLCGHIHEQPGVATLNDTTVVNCTLGRGGGALIELAAGERPRVTML
jgi:Icc-related predicted phosphoesterase